MSEEMTLPISMWRLQMRDGICKPEEQVVKVKVQGAGTLLAVGSGAHRTEEKVYRRQLYHMQWSYGSRDSVRGRGRRHLCYFSSDGLPDKTIKLEVR